MQTFLKVYEMHYNGCTGHSLVYENNRHVFPTDWVYMYMNVFVTWQDVIFSVTYVEFDRPDPTLTHSLVPACKCDSHKQAVRGELTAKQTGVYSLLFDNTYSR